jgi:hypothetical protein
VDNVFLGHALERFVRLTDMQEQANVAETEWVEMKATRASTVAMMQKESAKWSESRTRLTDDIFS